MTILEDSYMQSRCIGKRVELERMDDEDLTIGGRRRSSVDVGTSLETTDVDSAKTFLSAVIMHRESRGIELRFGQTLAFGRRAKSLGNVDTSSGTVGVDIAKRFLFPVIVHCESHGIPLSDGQALTLCKKHLMQRTMQGTCGQ